MANTDERKARDLKELNLALHALRTLANEEGYVAGSPVQLIYDAFTNSGINISLSRIKDLVTVLGRLGWREEAWSNPGNVRGSKITMQPERILSLEPLPAKVERERFEREVFLWFAEYHKKIVGSWTIINPDQQSEDVTVVITGRYTIKPRGRSHHWAFSLDNVELQPQWLKDLLSPDRVMADSTLYKLWRSGCARMHKAS